MTSTHLSTYENTLIDGKKYIEREICVLFHLDFRYELNEKEFKLICDNEPFSFEWINFESVSDEKIANRLREAVLNPLLDWWILYMKKNTVGKGNIFNKISTEDLIQAVLLREKIIDSKGNFLFLIELSNRNAIPNERLTESFRRKMTEKTGIVRREELQFYWDNSLLDDLLNSKSSWVHVLRVLEVNADDWSIDKRNTKKVYEYFVKSLNFNAKGNLEPDEIAKWINDVKIIATSRDLDFVNYLKIFLDNETEYTIEDWSRYRYSGIAPKRECLDLATIRVCDVAFVALLRALNQFEFASNKEVGTTRHYSMKIKEDILSRELINKLRGIGKSTSGTISFSQLTDILSNDIYLGLFEKHIKLTPDLKKKIKGK